MSLQKKKKTTSHLYLDATAIHSLIHYVIGPIAFNLHGKRERELNKQVQNFLPLTRNFCIRNRLHCYHHCNCNCHAPFAAVAVAFVGQCCKNHKLACQLDNLDTIWSIEIEQRVSKRASYNKEELFCHHHPAKVISFLHCNWMIIECKVAPALICLASQSNGQQVPLQHERCGWRWIISLLARLYSARSLFSFYFFIFYSPLINFYPPFDFLTQSHCRSHRNRHHHNYHQLGGPLLSYPVGHWLKFSCNKIP